MNFKEWIVSEGSNPGSKTGLYPLGYGGVGNYPPAWYLTRSADAIYYMTIDERIYKGKEGGEFNISHIPPKSKETTNRGEGGLWNIKHIGGEPTHKTGTDMAANFGDKGIWDISKIKKN